MTPDSFDPRNQERAAAQAAILALIPGSVPVGTWTVHPIDDSTAACTLLDDRVANLPAGTLPEDRLVLIHEQGHVRWDLPLAQLEQVFPAVQLPYVLPFYRMLREWVVDKRLTAVGLDIRPSANLLDWSQMADPATMPLDALARTWMQWYYRSLHPSTAQECQLYVKECWSLLAPPDRDLLERAYQEIGADIWDDQRSEVWAVKLAQHFAPPPPPPAPVAKPPERQDAQLARARAEVSAAQRARTAQQARQADAAQSLQRYDPAQALADSQQVAFEPTDALDDDGRDVAGVVYGNGAPDGSRGAGTTDTYRTIRVHRHLDTRRPGRRIKDPIGVRTFGAVPTHTEYVRMGGAIFKESPRPTGAILLDVSLSMQWTEDQLREALRIAPNLVVAGYANSSRVGCMLCVIAERGRTSHSVPCATGGQNDGSDLAALLWLARQPEPRVVVSDGAFYGRALPSTSYCAVCCAIMRRHRIVRVASMDDALSWLRRKLTPVSAGDDSVPPTPQRRRR